MAKESGDFSLRSSGTVSVGLMFLISSPLSPFPGWKFESFKIIQWTFSPFLFPTDTSSPESKVKFFRDFSGICDGFCRRGEKSLQRRD